MTAQVHSLSAYANGRCKCAECREIASAYQRKLRRRRPPLPEDDRRHGTENGYVNWNCRCVECTRAMTLKARIRSRKRRERSEQLETA